MSDEPDNIVGCSKWLEGCASNTYSQYGEDGFIGSVFARVGETNRWCFECGASDGMTYSNVRRLIEQDWNAALVDCDNDALASLALQYGGNPRVHIRKAYIEPTTFDGLLIDMGVPSEPDFGVIDIDEQDFWVWAGMRVIRPRVMMVEYAAGRPADQVPPLRLDKGEPSPLIQAGKHMIHYMGCVKGYTTVAMTLCNALFVRNDVLEAADAKASG